MFIGVLLVPLLMFISGIIMWKHPPKDINKIIGYRTARSMKNTDTWNFAHNLCGKIWLIMGILMLTLSVIVLCLFYNSTQKIIAITAGIICSIQITVMLLSILPTEFALKMKFTDEGTRK